MTQNFWVKRISTVSRDVTNSNLYCAYIFAYKNSPLFILFHQKFRVSILQTSGFYSRTHEIFFSASFPSTAVSKTSWRKRRPLQCNKKNLSRIRKKSPSIVASFFINQISRIGNNLHRRRNFCCNAFFSPSKRDLLIEFVVRWGCVRDRGKNHCIFIIGIISPSSNASAKGVKACRCTDFTPLTKKTAIRVWGEGERHFTWYVHAQTHYAIFFARNPVELRSGGDFRLLSLSLPPLV